MSIVAPIIRVSTDRRRESPQSQNGPGRVELSAHFLFFFFCSLQAASCGSASTCPILVLKFLCFIQNCTGGTYLEAWSDLDKLGYKL